jgi:predicted dienelactone hydrolase
MTLHRKHHLRAHSAPLPRRAFLCRAGAVAAMAAMAALGTPSQRALAAPGDAGRFDIHELDWHDPQRERPVPALLYLPLAAGPTAPVPLVVFSHGLGGSRRGYSHLGRHWAAHGCASLHLQHVGSDRRLWSGGNPLELLARLREAASEAEAIARVQDLGFALDQVLGSEFAARIDAGRIVAAGHSYGANTALLAAGARLERGGREVAFRDERVRAAMLLSSPPFHGEREPARIAASVQLPTLHVTATGDTVRLPGYYSGAEDRIALFEAMGGTLKALAVFRGGTHSIFTDRAGTGGFELNSRVKAATQELTLAFLRGVLDGEDRALREWPQRHAALLERFVAPAAGLVRG